MEERRHWASLSELAMCLEGRAILGKRTMLSPETAQLISDALRSVPSNQPPPPGPGARFVVDMYSAGSTVYRLDRRDEMLEVVAWAESTLIAQVAYQALVKRHPDERYLQKRRSWVEEEPQPRSDK